MRQLSSTHRFTVLGFMWPLARQLTQLAVLAFVFSKVVDLGIEDYATFLFSGLVAWSWFSGGISAGTSSLLDNRNLAFQPSFPVVILPLVAVTVALADLLIALPVLIAMAVGSGELYWTAAFLPVLLAVQFVLMCGIVWLTAAATVYLRDVRNVVGVALLLLFYLTPVFYGLSRVPDRYQWLLQLNPLTTLIEAYRSVLLDASLPDAGSLGLVALASVVIATAGLMLFRRLERGFVDEL
ncbi:MAG: ABC transporter permease [Solirubrobacterales bacterium]